jgi:hypothetical protein
MWIILLTLIFLIRHYQFFQICQSNLSNLTGGGDAVDLFGMANRSKNQRKATASQLIIPSHLIDAQMAVAEALKAAAMLAGTSAEQFAGNKVGTLFGQLQQEILTYQADNVGTLAFLDRLTRLD